MPTPAPQQHTVSAMSAAEMLGLTDREFILLTGKDGSGKSCAIVSLAWFVQYVLNPNATFYIIDTEYKFQTAWKNFGDDRPTNVALYQCPTMNSVNEAFDQVMGKRKAGDWLAVESMSRVWERAQDMGYNAVSGYDKSTYLDKRRELSKQGKGQAAVIPSPDQFWNVVKGAHDAGFIDQMSEALSMNVILSTTISKPPKEGRIKEGDTRKEVRAEFGLDVGIDGAPRLPYYAETFLAMDIKQGGIICRVVRDNKSILASARGFEFAVPTRRDWAPSFWTECRKLG